MTGVTHRSFSFPTQTALAVVVAAAAGFLVAGSVVVRQWRTAQMVHELPAVTSDEDLRRQSGQHLASVMSVVRRAGLMGQHISVKAELNDIRQWHSANDYKGGLVVRDLTLPLWWLTDNDNDDDESNSNNQSSTSPSAGDWSSHMEEIWNDPMRLARRECYYLYYEITPNGKIIQQIFCRGTALWVDILTCMQAWMVYDVDLGCRIHKGFRDQADRVMQDVLPLLASNHDRRAEVELCGHSLGAAVAAILAVKLRKRGYRVTKLTTIGEPAYVADEHAARVLQDLLPANRLRVEDDLDFVPFLPPFGSHVVGNKLWLTACAGARFVPKTSSLSTNEHDSAAWTDSVLVNFCVPEILLSNGKPHRIPNYLERLAALDGGTTLQPDSDKKV